MSSPGSPSLQSQLSFEGCSLSSPTAFTASTSPSPSSSRPPTPPLSAPASFVFTSSRYATPDTKVRLQQNLSRTLRTQHAGGAINVKYSALPFIMGSGGFIALRSPSEPVLPSSEGSPQPGKTDYFSQSTTDSPSSSPDFMSFISTSTSAEPRSPQKSSPPPPGWTSVSAPRRSPQSSPQPPPRPPVTSSMGTITPTSRSFRIPLVPDHNVLFPRDLDRCLVELVQLSKRRKANIEVYSTNSSASPDTGMGT